MRTSVLTAALLALGLLACAPRAQDGPGEVHAVDGGGEGAGTAPPLTPPTAPPSPAEDAGLPPDDGGDGDGPVDGGGAPEVPPPPEDARLPPPPPVPAGDYESTATTCTPTGPLFIDAIAAERWLTIEVTSGAGMKGLGEALAVAARDHFDRPVRVRLAAGTYEAVDASPVFEVVGLARTAAAPLLIEAVDKAPGATRLAQGLAFIGGSYLALDGLSFGPPAVGAFHGSDFCQPGSCYHDAPKPLPAPAALAIAGTALAPDQPGENGGRLDFAIYGRYAPAHHIVLRRLTIQNLFGDDEPSGVGAAASDADGISLRHAADVWILGSRIRQVSRHGIDAVGVHGACVLGNFIAEVGGGQGITVRGGLIDVTLDGNTLYDVRRLQLGGEPTDAVLHWSVEPVGSPLHYAYEARRLVVRNNLIVDARQGALELAGCRECAVVGNSVLFRPGFDLGGGGGDAIRETASAINRGDASSSCRAADGVLVQPCWGVGPHPAELVAMPSVDGEGGSSRVLLNGGSVLANNLFASADGFWGPSFNPYRTADAALVSGLQDVDHNYWWNGGAPLSDPGDDTWLKEGPNSIFASNTLAVGITVGFLVDAASAGAAGVVRAALRPPVTSPLVGRGTTTVMGFAAHDGVGAVRGSAPTLGALEP